MLHEAVLARRPSDLPTRASRSARRACCALIALLAAAAAAADPGIDGAGAEALVRRVYFEGVPYASARSLDDAGTARLAAMLLDPGERSWWPNIVVVLGMAGRAGAYEAISGAGEAGSSGELDRPTYKLQTAIPLAMGHLARSDPRALTWLVARARDAGGDPGWSFRSLRGAPLADRLRGLALWGLALSGRPEARPILEAIAGEGKAPHALGTSELAAQADEALRLHARIAEEGPAAVFAAGGRE